MHDLIYADKQKKSNQLTWMKVSLPASCSDLGPHEPDEGSSTHGEEYLAGSRSAACKIPRSMATLLSFLRLVHLDVIVAMTRGNAVTRSTGNRLGPSQVLTTMA